MEMLPPPFLQRMENLLQQEYEEFIKSYHYPRSFGLRVNTLKISTEAFQSISPFSLEGIPWTSSGFYYREEDSPGKHPYHAAGLYYIQEPSAMAVAEVMDIKPGERVLDLCGAPGGKATQGAAFLNGEGLLVANEIIPSRARILSENIERMGIRNALVTCEVPQQLARRFPAYFDKIIVDAPCSGEGMFRKDPQACSEWTEKSPTLCSGRQLDILAAASTALKPGGRMVYSTCTFAPEENEGVISSFLKDHHDFKLLDIHLHKGFSRAVPQWVGGEQELSKAVRLWPHKVRGEGHFIALMERAEGFIGEGALPLQRVDNLRDCREFYDFAHQNLKNFYGEGFLRFGDELYLCPPGTVDLRGIRVLRPGWHLGTVKKNRFEPGHALALGLKEDGAVNTIRLSSTSPEIKAYLKGEALSLTGARGWNLVLADGFPVGWGKMADGWLKNHYPKGLRWL